MRTAVAALTASLLAFTAALGGAWTLDRNKVAVFAGVTTSQATRLYDDGGAPSRQVVFNKLLSQGWFEYGLTGAVTLFAATEYVLAASDMTGSGVAQVRSTSVEAGARVLLLSRIGMLSVQLSAKSAGAFDMSVSASGEAGRQFEARLLYGRSFKLLGRDAFFDIEVAERWIARPRPDELVFDVTAGIQVTKNNQLLIQSFNFRTDGGARPPYQSYRLSKLQASLVHRLSQRWWLQSGYFFSLTGRNIVQETGVVGSIWFRT